MKFEVHRVNTKAETDPDSFAVDEYPRHAEDPEKNSGGALTEFSRSNEEILFGIELNPGSRLDFSGCVCWLRLGLFHGVWGEL